MTHWHTPAAALLCELARYVVGSPHSRLRQMAALRRLDDRLLADIGVSREDTRGRSPVPRTAAGAAMLRPLPPGPRAARANGP